MENKTQQMGISLVLAKPDVQRRFEQILGKKAQGFISSVINTVNNNKALKMCDPKTVLMSAVVAATLDLPIDKNLGFAWIIPYGNQASFQMGYKGYIQLAQRTGQYKTIHADKVFEGEFVSRNKLTGEIVFDWDNKKSDNVVGYTAYFKLINGFEKSLFWTAEEVETHAGRYSQAYKAKKKDSPWFTDYDIMAMKTVLKYLLSKWGILSIEMQSALKYDQGVVEDVETEKVSYPDNTDTEDAEVVDDFSDDKTPDDKVEKELFPDNK